jgi:hypothetical protein
MTSLMNRVLDAEQSAFLENELEVVISTTYEKKIPEYKCRLHIPINREAGPAAETIGIDTYEEIGMSKIISSYSDDWPRVDVVAKRDRIEVRPLGDSYGYNFQEVRASAATGKNLNARRAMAAKRFIMKSENKLAYLGDVESGIRGLLTYQTTPRVLSDVDMLDPLVPNQIKLQRLNQWARIPWLLAEFEVTAALFTKDLHGFLTSTSRSEQSDTFLMDLFRKANPTINFVDWCSECEGAGINGSDVAIFYVRTPDCVEMHIPQDFEQLPPDDRGKEVIIDCHERFAGVAMNQPLSAVIVENL